MHGTRLIHRTCYIGLLFLLLFPTCVSGENSKNVQQNGGVAVVDFTDYSLSVHAQHVDINDVLEEITSKTGVKIETETPLNVTISISFRKKGFTRGMKQIVSQIKPGEFQGEFQLGETFRDSIYTIRKISDREIVEKREKATAFNIQGEKLLSEGNDYQAYHVFIKALLSDPNFLPAHKNLVNVYQQWENYPRLTQRLEKVIHLAPEDPGNYRLLADAYRLDYQYDKALENYQRFIQRINSSVQQDTTQKIVAQLQRSEVREYFQNISDARDLVKAKKYDHAAQVLQQAIGLAPLTPKAYELLALVKEIERDYSAAITLRQKIARLTPDDPVNYRFLAKDLRMLLQHEAALEYLTKAKDLSWSEYMSLQVEKDLSELKK